jgi:hypothetical protein
MTDKPLYRDARERAIAEIVAAQRSRLVEIDPPEDPPQPRKSLLRVAVPFSAAAILIAGGFLVYSQIAPATIRTASIRPTLPLSDSPPPERERPTLKVEDSSGTINEPLPLGIRVIAGTPGETVHLKGMPPGTRVTGGVSAAPGEWRIAVNDLSLAAITPPRDYVGSLTVSAELHGANDQTLATSSVFLNWVQPPPPPPPPVEIAKPLKPDAPPAKPNMEIANAGPIANPPVANPIAKPNLEVAPMISPAPAPAPAAVAVAAPTPVPAPLPLPPKPSVAEKPAAPEDVARKIAPNELAALIKRGEELSASGDLPAARLLLQRAAEAHDPRAAFLLATTYDPVMIKSATTNNPLADPKLARAWYQKARDWGSLEAKEKLDALASKER